MLEHIVVKRSIAETFCTFMERGRVLCEMPEKGYMSGSLSVCGE